MVMIKKNIWLLFGFIVLVGSLVFALYISYLWERNVDKFRQLQHNQVELFANNAQNFLKSQESLLEVLGNQLAIDSNIPSSAQHSAVLDRVAATHPTVAGLALANLDGDLVAVSSNLNLDTLPNLLDQDVSRASFLATLESNRLVVGRTYLLSALQDASMAMAIRKAVRDSDGEPVAVMTAGIKVDSNYFSAQLPEFQRMDIIRGDGFYQFSSDFERNATIYEQSVSSDLIEQLANSISTEYDHSEQGVGLISHPYSVDIVVDGTGYLVEACYDSYFDLWTVSRIEKAFILETFQRDALVTSLLFIGGFLVVFSLAKSIAKSDAEQLKELHYQACHDELTGLPNMRQLKKNFNEIKGSERGLILIDVDRFKGINDFYGVSFADQLLIDVVSRLQFFSSESLTLYRGVGDEFYLSLNDAKQKNTQQLCEQILETISKPYSVRDSHVLITASIAVANSPVCGDGLENFMRSLDASMLHAKKTRNSISHVTPDLQQTYLKKLKIEHRLGRALSNHELTMVYQPQIDLRGSVYGLEALVRWTDSELGIIPPDAFIATAEQAGMMPELGRQILDMSLRDYAQIRSQVDQRFSLSINISVVQLVQENFAEHLQTLVDKYRIETGDLVLELTENVFIEDLILVTDKCNQLSQLGVKLSLDDFGTGYSSLGLLNKLPFSELKIDKSFVDEICSDMQSRLMLKNILSIADNYQIPVVAEGVEDNQQRDILTKLGCTQFQGYLFAKPMKPIDVIAFIHRDVESSA